MAPARQEPPAASQGELDLSDLWEQDVEIDVRVRTLVQAIDRGDAAASRDAAEGLESFVLGHLEREEEIYFPAAIKVDPGLAGNLTTIRLAHRGIREDLRELCELLDRGHLEAARQVSSAFLESFRSHEQAEDRLVNALGQQRG